MGRHQDMLILSKVISYSKLFNKLCVRTQALRNIKHLLGKTKSNIQFIASGQGNIGRSEAKPNIILYGHNQLDVGRGQVQ